MESTSPTMLFSHLAVLNHDFSSNDDEKNEKITLMKLLCDNLTEWKKFFKNLLDGSGHEEIFDDAWCTSHANNKIL